MAIAAARGPPASAKTGETITESLHVLTPARGRLKSQFGRGSKVMRNAKTLAIAATLGLGLIFSSPIIARAQEAQTGGLPTLEDRVEALAAAVAADHALILEIETDLGEVNSSLTKTFVFNANAELSSTTTITVATLPVTVGGFEAVPASHRLVINYSSVGAIQAATATPALLFIGCFVDGIACVGSQADPGTTPAGYVNVLSTDFPGSTAWDNSVDHVWYTAKLSPGAHTVVIKAAVGNPLVPFMGTGTLFDEARNLVVTVLGAAD